MMNRKWVFLSILFLLVCLAGCNNKDMHDFYGTYTFEEVSYLSGLSSCTVDYVEKLRTGTVYTIEADLFKIESAENTVEINSPNYVREEIPNDFTILSDVRSFIEDFALRYGYDWGIILASNKQKTELLLYNEKIDTKDDLKAKRIELNHESGAEYAEDAYLPEELQGYSFGFKYGDENQKEHLLAVRSRVEPHQKKLYSDLLVIDKDNLEQMTILQFYAQGYDPSTGRVPQGTIPTIIDFTVDLIDDYIVYHDTDLFWKVQDVRSGEIYASEENETSLQKVEICYQEEEQDRLVSGKYIYILKYIDDNSVLAFDTTSKKFSFIK